MFKLGKKGERGWEVLKNGKPISKTFRTRDDARDHVRRANDLEGKRSGQGPSDFKKIAQEKADELENEIYRTYRLIWGAHPTREGFTNGQKRVLQELIDHQDTPMISKHFQDVVGCTGGNITTVITNLEKMGFVRRLVDTENRRQTYIELDEAGHTLTAEELAPFPLKKLYTEKEAETLLELLQRIT